MMKKTEKKPTSKIEDEEEEKEEEDNAATLTQMALQTHAESASASTITESFAGMMEDIQTFQETNKEENEGDAVVVMNVALRIRGVSPEEFHQMDEAHRQTAVNAAFMNCDIGNNNITTNNETENAEQIDEADMEDDVTDGTNSTDDSASTSVEGASNAPTSSNKNAAAAADEDDKEPNVENVDGNVEAMQTSTDPAASPTKELKSQLQLDDRASNVNAVSFNPSLALERKDDDADDNNAWNKMLEDNDGGAPLEDGDGDDDDDDEERSVAQQLWDSAVISAQEKISMRTDKANAELGSLIGIENAVAELNDVDLDGLSLTGGVGIGASAGGVDRRWDQSKLVAFPPLWIESGAKVKRRFIPDANFAKRLQDWDSEVPKRETVYSIAIKHNLEKLRRKCYGCVNHRDPGYGRCLGYVDKEPEAASVWYANVPTPTAPPSIGQGLVPRKQQKDLQQRMAQRRHEPFKYNDIYTRAEFRLNKSVPYYARKPRPPGGGGNEGGAHDDGRRRHAPAVPNRDQGVARGIAKELRDEKPAAITGPVDSSRLAELARPKAMNICRNYFPREYMTSFENPRDQRGFKEVELFLPKEERDKVNRTVDGWSNAKPNNKDKKKKNDDDF